MTTEQESFLSAERLAVITDKTKPAMKWTINELTSRGKKVYVVDISDKPDSGTLQNVSLLPSGVENAIIGVTGVNPADVMQELEKKGIKKFWVHWRTETPEVIKRCAQVQCITGKCPMMYLAHGLSIHTAHRGVAKLMGKY